MVVSKSNERTILRYKQGERVLSGLSVSGALICGTSVYLSLSIEVTWSSANVKKPRGVALMLFGIANGNVTSDKWYSCALTYYFLSCSGIDQSKYERISCGNGNVIILLYDLHIINSLSGSFVWSINIT
jgi:hypothetical protein